MSRPAVILDVDGTLIDNNYQHALAWHLALRRVDLHVPVWQAHRAIGIGSEKIVAELAGDDAEARCGDEARDHQSEIFDMMIDEVEPLPGAEEFVRSLSDRGHSIVLASSGDAADIERFIELLDVEDALSGWTTSDDVDASKPKPDLVEVALEKAGGGDAVMIGDTPWDVRAAARAGLKTICVLTGGFSEAELREAEAAEIYDSVDELRNTFERSDLLQ